MKYLYALVLGVVFALIATMVVNLPLDAPHACVLAGIIGLFGAWVTDKVGQANWLVTAVLLVLGAGLHWGLGQISGVYVMVVGLGLLAGTLAFCSPATVVPTRCRPLTARATTSRASEQAGFSFRESGLSCFAC